jgi:hypothetical protein
MSDEFDRASELEEMHREMAIKNARVKAQLPDIGQCYYCAEYTPPGRRFCDSECRDGYEAEMAAKKRNG